MKYIIGLESVQGSEPWHALRRTKIGASNSPALLGLSPYKTSGDVYDEMVLGTKPFITKAMQHGTDSEGEARVHFNRLDPSDTYHSAVVVSDEHDIMMASLDGINVKETNLLEIKCPGLRIYEDCVNGKVPIHWQYQIQHQLAVTGLNSCTLFVWANSFTNMSVTYQRDEEKISEIIFACLDFRDNYLSKGIRPEANKITYQEREDALWKQKVSDYLLIKQQREDLEEKEKIAYETLLAEANGIPTRGCGIRIEKSEKKGLIDYSLIGEIKGLNLEIYRKPSKIQWRICATKH